MKILTGKVISTKMPKTATIVVERVVVHPLYGKRVRRRKKYHVQDESGARVGQVVKFVASKPFSKSKRWKIIEMVSSERKTATQRRKRNSQKTRK